VESYPSFLSFVSLSYNTLSCYLLCLRPSFWHFLLPFLPPSFLYSIVSLIFSILCFQLLSLFLSFVFIFSLVPSVLWLFRFAVIKQLRISLLYGILRFIITYKIFKHRTVWLIKVVLLIFHLLHVSVRNDHLKEDFINIYGNYYC
jgi:hypothetical protein